MDVSPLYRITSVGVTPRGRYPSLLFFSLVPPTWIAVMEILCYCSPVPWASLFVGAFFRGRYFPWALLSVGVIFRGRCSWALFSWALLSVGVTLHGRYSSWTLLVGVVLVGATTRKI